MHIDSLRVLHLSKAEASPETISEMVEAMDRASLCSGAFFLDSCQRIIYFGTEQSFSHFEVPAIHGLEIFKGKAAYQFLLRVATGLESRIQGETDIFGQLKNAWANNKELDLETRIALSPWVQRIFEDTKEIRTQYIQNAGGASYGSLVRRMLHEAAHESTQGATLLVGAGQLAQSVAPYLLDRDLLIYNRTPASAHILAKTLRGEERDQRQVDDQEKIRVLELSDEEFLAWNKVSAVVLCVPEDSARDDQRILSLLTHPNLATVSVIHLGIEARAAKKWSVIPGFRCLTHVFELEKSQGDVRSVLLKKAALACEERAKLRALGGSLSIAHGWEDLAAFG